MRPFGLPVSALLHAAGLVLILLLASHTRAPAPLFVDLSLEEPGPRAASSASTPARAPAREVRPGGGVRAREAASPPALTGARAGSAPPSRPAPADVPQAPDSSAPPLPRPSVQSLPLLPVAPPAPAAVAPSAPPSTPPAGERVVSLLAEPLSAPRSPDASAALSPSRARADGESGSPGGAGAGRRATTSESSGAGLGVGTGGTDGGNAGPGSGEGGTGGSALASSRGTGGGGPGAEYGSYLRLWRSRIHEGLSYPPAARRRNLRGTVHIEITIEATGALSEVKVVESSSHPLLDEAAVQSVRNLSPIPFPPHLVPRALRARLPVVFDLR